MKAFSLRLPNIILTMQYKIIFLIISFGITIGQGVADMDSGRPSVFLNSEGLTRLRTELKSIRWKRAIYRNDQGPRAFFYSGGIKPNADRWLAREVAIPPRGGHSHHFFCECGNRLQYPEDLKPHNDGYPCSACDKTYTGEKYDAAVYWRLHNELATAAFDLALVYAVEQDVRYARKAAEILTKYADAYPGPHTTHVEGGIIYQSLCEAVWSIPLAAAYDLCSETLTAEDRTRVEEDLFKPVAAGLRKVGIGGNWGSWHLSAVGVIGYSIRDQELIDYALTSFKSQISNQLGDDGLWPESVHTYHFYPLNAFLFLAEAAFHNATDLYHWEAKPGKSLKAMFTAPLSYMYPDFRLPAINDGWFDAFLPLQQYELAHARCDDPAIAWALKEGYRTRKTSRAGIWALLHGQPLDEDLPPPDIRSINFPVLGIAVLRSPGGNVLTFDHGPHLGHGQHDKFGITLFANGKLFAPDYGTPGYGSPILSWYRNTPGHNTIVVNKKTQALTKERKLTLFAPGDFLEAAEAESDEIYPGVLHRRTVIRVGEYFLVLDRLESDAKRTFDWFFRSEGELTVGLDELHKLEIAGYPYVEEKAQYETWGAWDAAWRQGDSGLALSMLDDDVSGIFRTECPAESGVRKIPLLIVRRIGTQADFTTALIPFTDRMPKCSVEQGLIKVEHDGFVDWITTRGSSGPLTTDARFAVVRTKDGEALHASAIGGKKTIWKGRVLGR